jgi:hypothetical protein
LLHRQSPLFYRQANDNQKIGPKSLWLKKGPGIARPSESLATTPAHRATRITPII